MRLGRYRRHGEEGSWVGLHDTPDTVIDTATVGEEHGIEVPRRTRDLLAMSDWRGELDRVRTLAHEHDVGVVDRDGVTTLAPIGSPSKVVCVGLNYRDHAEEGGNPIPDEPVLFAKFPSAVNDPGGTIRWDPELTDRVDFESELVIAIGRRTRRVAVEEARSHVAGYLVGNDVTARDLQRRDGQWVRGKSLDTFAPIGPELVTDDEVDDPHDLDIWTEVNGERMQDSSTSNLIFGVDELVSFCSQAFTLLPGDLIFTGTPPGVGTYREPPVYLGDGDTVTVGIEGLGELTNTCEPASG